MIIEATAADLRGYFHVPLPCIILFFLSFEPGQVYDRLKMLKRELSSAAASSSRSGGGAENLKRWKEDVDAIDEERAASGGVFGGVVAVKEEGGEDGSTSAVVAPPGQFICNYLLDECYRLLHQLSASER